MSEGNLVVGAKIECKQGTDPVKELKVPDVRNQLASGKKRIYMNDVTPGKNFDIFGKCKLLIINGVMQPCAPVIAGSKWLATNAKDVNEKKESSCTMGSFMVCAKGCLIEPISTGQGGPAPISSEKMSLEDLALKQMLTAEHLSREELIEISSIFQKTEKDSLKNNIFDKLFPKFNEETAAYTILERQLEFLNAKVPLAAHKFFNLLSEEERKGINVGIIQSKLEWDTNKVNLLWDKVRDASREYNMLLDPRILISTAFVEGTGSFNTNNQELAGDGGAGLDHDFDRDAHNAILLLARKVASYNIYSENFKVVAEDAKLKGNFLEYMTHNTPQLGHKYGVGVYAENSQLWSEQVNQKLMFMYDFKEDFNINDYTKYINATDFSERHDIQGGIAEGIDIEYLPHIFDDDRRYTLDYQSGKFICTLIPPNDR